MRLLRQILEAGVDDLTSRSEQPNVLPAAIMRAIQNRIREGARPNKETGQYEPWANALHLVHKAYEVEQVQRPDPSMKDLWKQYEENIEYAVKELSKERGMDGEWRMTAHEFHDKK